MIDDPYEVLQVHPKADREVIQAAFRTLARKYHPDFGGTGARMVSLNDAWAIVGQPRRRSAYDKSVAARAQAAAAAAAAASASVVTSVPVMQATRPAPPTSSSWTDTAGTEWDRQQTSDHRPFASASGTVLDFGRYAGWSLGELARQDPYYLEWLERTPIGRPLRAEIQSLLGERLAAAGATAVKPASRPRRRWGR
jgi:curved DNA-binding protein CbpA